MIQAKIINRINFPKIALQDDLEYIAKNIIIPDMIRGIDDSMAITGGPLPPNSPETIARKKKKGRGDKPLIDTGTLRRSFDYKTSGKSKVIVYIDDERMDAARGLQYGLRTRRYNFFGISGYAYDTAIAYMKKKIGELIRGSKRK